VLAPSTDSTLPPTPHRHPDLRTVSQVGEGSSLSVEEENYMEIINKLKANVNCIAHADEGARALVGLYSRFSLCHGLTIPSS
jgi:hypothetical protein